jgi:hypothetical protein
LGDLSFTFRKAGWVKTPKGAYVHQRIEAPGNNCERSYIKQNHRFLNAVTIEQEGKRLAIRTQLAAQLVWQWLWPDFSFSLLI